MPRHTDALAIVVACDDGQLRERVASGLRAAGGVDVVAAVDTVRMAPSVTRLRPEAVILISPRPRHIDLGRIGTLTRERANRPAAVVLLADEPETIVDRARAAGTTFVGPVPRGDDAVADLAAELRRLHDAR